MSSDQPKPLEKVLITRYEPLENDNLRVHYLLPSGERRAITMPSILQTYGYHREIGDALAANDRRIRGKRL